MSIKKKLIFQIIILAIIFFTMESVSYVVLWRLASISTYRGYFLSHNWAKFVDGIEDAKLDSYFFGSGGPLYVWDLGLGWDNRPGAQMTQRDNPVSIDEFGAHYNDIFSGMDPLITTYGDSFTFCDDVADNETWQYYLSKELGEYVANFGVGGYGPDQALLKYIRSNNGRESIKIVILGIYEIDRRCPMLC